MKCAKSEKKSAFDTYIFIVLVCLEVLMSFTFLGYIHVPPISVTFAYIPILIAACLLGTAQSTVIGVVFGLASMYKSSAHYVMPSDMIFSPVLSGNPLGSIFVSLISRTVFGLVMGLIFFAAKKSRHTKLWTTLGTVVSTRLHAFFVYLAMGIFFPQSGYNWTSTFHFRLGDIALIILCIFLVNTIQRIYNSDRVQKFKNSIDKARENYIDPPKKHTMHSVFTIFLVAMTMFATLYFSQRTSYMLERHGLEVDSAINADLIHLQIQFMFAVIALNVISIVILVLDNRYTTYQKFLGEFDTVTGIMGRKIFLDCCEEFLSKDTSPSNGWFLFIDIDDFKGINDTFGHATGDKVLRSVATVMKKVFDNYGLTGRLGGDEFSAIIKEPIERREVEMILDRFLIEISAVAAEPHGISCSIGVCRYSRPTDLPSLMESADVALYEAKSRGKACYVING